MNQRGDASRSAGACSTCSRSTLFATGSRKPGCSEQRPDLAEFLAAVPANVEAHLFRDLLSLDLEYRRQRGEQPDCTVVPRTLSRVRAGRWPRLSNRILRIRPQIRRDRRTTAGASDRRLIRKAADRRRRAARVLRRTNLRRSAKPATKSWASWGVGEWALSSKPTKPHSTGPWP